LSEKKVFEADIRNCPITAEGNLSFSTSDWLKYLNNLTQQFFTWFNYIINLITTALATCSDIR
jgi:hypothetical protein